jgi:hypothetical protein
MLSNTAIPVSTLNRFGDRLHKLIRRLSVASNMRLTTNVESRLWGLLQVIFRGPFGVTKRVGDEGCLEGICDIDDSIFNL